ncbi:MAG TPA: ATPase, T2SS/T4P/T4SS family [Phycisphaerae bacterium]|nr:ATPase, T2SS/T4P/T4SS family [Phycisphaerae bacterium]HRY66689.1 ATPase, T2SS/T4P/T4SS family [Phycisphaerae bacterium]HSA27608.1 ATPase, T2SS/T4P/T4SS family [Phycisphaerae bacterium]
MQVPSSKPTWGWWAGVALGAWLAGQDTALAAGPLAELPEPGGYTSWIRILIILVMMVPWLLFCQWVDKDALFVRRVNQAMWNVIVLAGGVIGLIVWLFLPWRTAGLFAAGFGLWLVITATSCAMYVIVRNGVVDPSARVFTPKHIKFWFANLGKKQADRHVVEERVKLVACDGRKVPVPDDPAKAEPYEAAQILLHDALWRRATEAELVVTAKGVKLAYRIDGVATPRSDLIDRDNAERALLFLKQIAGLDITERRKPQTGEIRASIGGDRGMTEVDVQTSGTTQHERLSLKIVGEETKLRLHDLGMSPSDLEKFESQVRQPGGGLFLISGPAGSGVTSTLYAALRSHDVFMQNLLTLEREPLMELENITQNIYDSTKHEGSYARQLQTVLRREPDVVMVSDCLDRETAHLAAKAAKDGKRIYLGIQAKDSFDALKKLVSLAGDTDTVASVIKMVTSQRLIRKLCIACRVAYKPDPQLLQKANLAVGKAQQFFRQPKPEELVDEKGNPRMCANCQNSAYYGRTGLFEVLTIDDTMRDLISRGQSINELRAQARKNGMLYLQEVGLQKVIEGITGMNEMLRVMRDEESSPPPAAPAAGKGGDNPPAAPAAPKKGA